jgi:arylsulfatase A-like enzyme
VPLAVALLVGAWASGTCCASEGTARPPNVVVIFTDDQGYGDLSCYGHPTIHTPHIDRMAAEGMKLTQFYVPSPVCSPSRAGLLTGCYPKRVGMHKHVIYPEYDYGLHTDEVTIADMLTASGYATACIGKWHLGHRPGLLPTDQGFATFFGIPFSNDMATYHRKPGHDYAYSLPLLRGDKVVEWEPDQHLLTKRFTEEAERFIQDNKARPFFLYLAHPMPHIPIYASEAFEGTSSRGTYGDVIQEIDWSVGKILAALAAGGIDQDTLVIFTSDNGPWKRHKANGGTAGALRGEKGTNFEGGQREPCIIRWPGHVPAGTVCQSLSTSMDLLPTIAEITGAKLPERAIDGTSLVAMLTHIQSSGTAPRDTFLYYTSKGDLAGIRRGDMKLLFAGPEAKQGSLLFNVAIDISEEWNLAEREPATVANLEKLARELDAEITADARPVRHVQETLWKWPRDAAK